MLGSSNPKWAQRSRVGRFIEVYGNNKNRDVQVHLTGEPSDADLDRVESLLLTAGENRLDIYANRTWDRPVSSTPTEPSRGDLCQGWLRTVDPVTGHVGRRLVTGLSSPVDIVVSGNGSVWLLQRHMTDTGPGGLLRLDNVG